MSVTALRTNGRKAAPAHDRLSDFLIELLRSVPRTRRGLHDASPRSLAYRLRVAAKVLDYDARERESRA